LRELEFRLVTEAARLMRVILTFPSATAPIETPAERSEKTSPARIPFEIVFFLILPSSLG
jgi:hypothetical protein